VSRSRSKRTGPAREPTASPPSAVRSKRGYQRREAILDAATAEFLQKGYQGASLRAIVAAAGGSSRTLYQQFGDKAGLFRAIVARLEAGVAGLTVPDARSGRPMEEELFEIGLSYLTSFLKPEPLAFFRMMVAESATRPEIPVLVWGATHKVFVSKLASYLREKGAQDGFHMEDPGLAALQFIEASKAALHLEMLFTGVEPGLEELVRHVRLAVRMFLQGAPIAGGGRGAPQTSRV